MKRLLPLLLTLFTLQSTAQEQDSLTAYFAYDKYILTEETKSNLESLAQKALANKFESITLHGHTDADGTNGYNEQLAQNRANAVRNYLIKQGIDGTKIKLSWHGEVKPVASNSNKDGMQKNRRVQILVEYPEVFVYPTEEELLNAELLHPVFRVNDKKVQSFSKSVEDTILVKAKGGTIILFPPDAFVDHEGNSVTGKVVIEVIEILSKPEMILNNVNTVARRRPLESGGMVHVTAKKDGKELKLKAGRNLTLIFAAAVATGEPMKTFYGTPRDSSRSWSLAEGNFLSTSPRSFYVTSVYYKKRKWLLAQWILGPKVSTTVIRVTAKSDSPILDSGRLGWINCDRFLRYRNITNVFVPKADPSLEYYLVFKNINSIMPAYRTTGGTIFFPNIPVGRKVTLLAYKKEKKSTVFGTFEFRVKKLHKVSVKVSEGTHSEFKKTLRGL